MYVLTMASHIEGSGVTSGGVRCHTAAPPIMTENVVVLCVA